MNKIYEKIINGKLIKLEWDPGLANLEFFMDDKILCVDYYCCVKDDDGVYRYKCKAWSIEKVASEVSDVCWGDENERSEMLEIRYNCDNNFYDENNIPLNDPEVIEDYVIIVSNDGIAKKQAIYTDPVTKEIWCQITEEKWF